MSDYYHTQPAYQALRYSGRYVPATPSYRAAEPARPANDDSLADLIGVHESWRPRRDGYRHDDAATAMLAEKADLAKMTVGSLVYQMIQRERLKDDNLLRLVYQEIEIDGRLLRLKDSWAPHAMLPDNSALLGLEAELARIDREKGAEEVACWRDVARLKDKLLESLGTYGDTSRRERMVAGPTAYAAGGRI
jgi:hypothetical protein